MAASRRSPRPRPPHRCRRQPPNAGPRPIIQRVSTARFIDGALDECADFEFRITPANPAQNPQPDLPDFATEMGDRIVGTRIQRPCSEQFTGRPVLARCVLGFDNEDQEELVVRTTMTALYYRSETVLESDAFMQQCLESGGDWQATATDDVARDARREARRRDLQKALRNVEALQRER